MPVANVPDGQGTGFDVRAGQYDPFSQGTHAVPFEYSPVAQGEGPFVGSLQIIPEGHGIQAVAPPNEYSLLEHAIGA